MCAFLLWKHLTLYSFHWGSGFITKYVFHSSCSVQCVLLIWKVETPTVGNMSLKLLTLHLCSHLFLKVELAQSCPTLNSSGQNIGVGSFSLFQGIFPTQGFNPGLPQCRWILYQLKYIYIYIYIYIYMHVYIHTYNGILPSHKQRMK